GVARDRLPDQEQRGDERRCRERDQPARLERDVLLLLALLLNEVGDLDVRPSGDSGQILAELWNGCLATPQAEQRVDVDGALARRTGDVLAVLRVQPVRDHEAAGATGR